MIKNGIISLTKNTTKNSIFQRSLNRNFISLTRTNFKLFNNTVYNNFSNQLQFLNFPEKKNSFLSISSKGMCMENEITRNEIYVGNLPWSAGEEDLVELFGRYGNVKSCRISIDGDGRSKGFGFVLFETREDLDRVMEDAYNIEMSGRRLRVNTSNNSRRTNVRKEREPKINERRNEPTSTLFVGNLSYHTTKESIIEHFENFGNIVDVRLPFNEEKGRIRGFCHIEFESVEVCQNALENREPILDGREIKTDFASPRPN